MLYTKDGSYPAPLPHRIVLSNGMTRTDASSFTEEEIADAGYVEVENPPQVPYPQRLDWDGESWLIRDPNESESAQMINQIKSDCVRMLADTDYKVIKAIELGQELDQEYVDYRQAVRELYNSVDATNCWNASYPVKPGTEIA